MRTKDMFRISHGTQTFSNVSAKIWNALFSKLDLNVRDVAYCYSYRYRFINNKPTIIFNNKFGLKSMTIVLFYCISLRND